MGFISKFLKKITLLISILVLGGGYLYSANLTDDYLRSKPNGNKLDKGSWEKLKNDYKYKTQKLDTTKKKKNLTPIASSYGNSNWIKVVAWLGIFVLAGFIIFIIIRYGLKGDKKIEHKISFDINDEIEDITKLNIDHLLVEALGNKNYKLATRLHFLMLLKVLDSKKIIHWKQNKTNTDYSIQPYNTEVHSLFNQVCRIYESVWYGNYPMNEFQFSKTDNKFRQIASLIGQKTYV